MMHAGGMTWGSTTYDPELNLIYFGTGNPQPVINGRKRAGRQPVHRVDRRAQSRHREDGVVLPVVAARHARLGCDPDAGPDRRTDRRRAAQAAGAGQPQRLVLRARSHERPQHPQHRVREDQLGERAGRERAADSRSAEGTAVRRRARLAQPGRRPELAAAKLQSANRPLLRQCDPRRSACTTSTRTRTTRSRRAGAATIAAAGRKRCCRRSTTGPAGSPGRTSGPAVRPSDRAC